jgi:hypothetical protein
MVFVEPRRLYFMEQEQQTQPEEILEVVEIEIFAIEEKPLPHAKRYIIRVDKEKVTVHKPELTGAEILALVSKTTLVPAPHRPESVAAWRR